MCTAALLCRMSAPKRAGTRKQEGVSRCRGRLSAHLPQFAKWNSRFRTDCSEVCDYGSFTATHEATNYSSRSDDLQRGLPLANSDTNCLSGSIKPTHARRIGG